MNAYIQELKDAGFPFEDGHKVTTEIYPTLGDLFAECATRGWTFKMVVLMGEQYVCVTEGEAYTADEPCKTPEEAMAKFYLRMVGKRSATATRGATAGTAPIYGASGSSGMGGAGGGGGVASFGSYSSYGSIYTSIDPGVMSKSIALDKAIEEELLKDLNTYKWKTEYLNYPPIIDPPLPKDTI